MHRIPEMREGSLEHGAQAPVTQVPEMGFESGIDDPLLLDAIDGTAVGWCRAVGKRK